MILNATTDAEDYAQTVASNVSVDTKFFSMSFNEYLTMVSKQKTSEPSEGGLMEVFKMFDKDGTGRIPELQLRKILSKKFGEDSSEIDEMMEEYGRLHAGEDKKDPEEERFVNYKDFVEMLQM